MDKRKRALSILEQARDLLGQRLIEDIIESGDSILEDAEGCSYMDEIDTVHQRVGGRLNSINIMIANLPAADSTGAEPESATLETPVAALEPEETEVPKPVNFVLFVEQIGANDVDGAARTLSELLDVDEESAHHCATSFRDRLNEDPTTLQRVMQLRTKLIAGENNDSLMILWDCFRLQGPQAVEVLQTLKARLAAA